MRVLITGGAGFIGSHVSELLLAQGHTLCVLDDLSRGRTDHVPRSVPLHMACVTHTAAEHVVRDFAPEAVVHLAAQMDVRASMANPVFDTQINVLGSVRMLHAAAQAGCKVFVLASSGGAIYGEAQTLPTSEQEPAQPMSPYGAAKWCDEIYLSTFCRQYPMRGIALRLGNVYGPRQNTQGEAGVVALFAASMAAGQTPRIYGDGRQTRDYVYVSDVAHAISLALSTQSAQGVFNIGTGVGTSLRDLIAALRPLTGFLGEPHYLPARPGEVRRSTLAYAAATHALGWQPRTSFGAGLQQTVAACVALQDPMLASKRSVDLAAEFNLK
jgi:UDP-glucose 4-epimerase